MKTKIYTIYDSKAKAYLNPFFQPEDGTAIRIFSDCINSKDHPFAKHPEDYTLFNIGAWADNTAILVMNEAPINLGNGIEYQTKTMEQRWSQLTEEEKQAEIDGFKLTHDEEKS